MADPRADIEEALKDAHLPALMAALVQMTGDRSWLRAEWTPVYNPLSRGDTGLSPEAEAEIRSKAAEAIAEHLGGKPMQMPKPDHATICRQMDFVAGAPIPEQYVDFLVDELVLEQRSTKDPHFETPKVQAAARRMKVLVVGAGMSGLLTGIRLTQAGVPFEIVDKNADVGGTWFQNTYPGCRVDNSNHMYSYSFEPNHAWPQHFSPQPVLLEYFRGIAKKYDLKKHIRFETLVETLAWDETKDVWRATLKGKDGKTEVVEATAVVTAVGQLNRPRFPDIEGLGSFEGPAFHSAEWRHDVDLKGKRVAVIGTGASAMQLIPEIAPIVGELFVHQRTPAWIAPTPDYHDPIADGLRWLYAHVPSYSEFHRFCIFWAMGDGALMSVTVDPDYPPTERAVSEMNEMSRELLTEYIRTEFADRPDLLEHVIPAYPPGSKRGIRDNGVWARTLKRDDVHLVTTPIAAITERGLRLADGTEEDVDVIIYGTGFKASEFLTPMRVIGRGGVELHDRWQGEARAYLGVSVPGYPNLFCLYGPNTNIVVNGSIVYFSECGVRFILGLIETALRAGKRAIHVRDDVHDRFNDEVDAANRLMAWGFSSVSSWYKNSSGRVAQNWPFTLLDYWQRTLRPDPDEFELLG